MSPKNNTFNNNSSKPSSINATSSISTIFLHKADHIFFKGLGFQAVAPGLGPCVVFVLSVDVKISQRNPNKETHQEKSDKLTSLSQGLYWLHFFPWHLYLPDLFQWHSRDRFLLPIFQVGVHQVTFASRLLVMYFTPMSRKCCTFPGLPAVAKMVAPTRWANCTATRPTPPVAAWMSTRSPFLEALMSDNLQVTKLLQSRVQTKMWWVERIRSCHHDMDSIALFLINNCWRLICSHPKARKQWCHFGNPVDFESQTVRLWPRPTNLIPPPKKKNTVSILFTYKDFLTNPQREYSGFHGDFPRPTPPLLSWCFSGASSWNASSVVAKVTDQAAICSKDHCCGLGANNKASVQA